MRRTLRADGSGLPSACLASRLQLAILCSIIPSRKGGE